MIPDIYVTVDLTGNVLLPGI